MNPNVRNFSLWVIIFLLVVALVMLFQNPSQREASQQITFSQLLTEVDQSRVREVTIAGNEITGHFNDNRAFSTYAPNDPTLVQKLYSKSVSIAARPPQEVRRAARSRFAVENATTRHDSASGALATRSGTMSM